MAYPKLTPIIATGATEPRYAGDRFADVLNVKDFGAKGDGVADDTSAIQSALDAGLDTGKTVVFPSGKYMFTQLSETATQTKRRISLQAIGKVVLHSTKSTFTYNDPPNGDPFLGGFTSDYAIGFFGYRDIEADIETLDSEAKKGDTKIDYVSDSLNEGDLVLLLTSHLVGGEHRSLWTQGQLCKVYRKTGEQTFFLDAVEIDLPAYSATNLTIRKDSSDLFFDTLSVDSERSAQYAVTGLTGVNAGVTSYITNFDTSTKQVMFEDPSNKHLYPGYFNVNSISNGDTFRFVKETKIYKATPITVHISGDFVLERNPVVSTEHTKPEGAGSNADEGFRGLMLYFNDSSVIDGMTVENFDCTSIGIMYSYKCLIKNCRTNNSSDNGTGYGVSLSGCYGCVVSECTMERNRCGVSTGDIRCNCINNVVRNCVCFGVGVPDNRYDEQASSPDAYPDSTGKIFFPVGSLDNQGFSTHGDAINHVIDSCTAYNVFMFSRLRGENETLINCCGYGDMNMFVMSLFTNGAKIANNLMSVNEQKNAEYACFYSLPVSAYHSYQKNIQLINNTALGIGGQFITLQVTSSPNVVNNVVAIGNVISFGPASPLASNIPSGNSIIQAGIGRHTTYNPMPKLSGCVFSGNKILNCEVDKKYGFFVCGYSADINNNDYVSTGENSWFVRFGTHSSENNSDYSDCQVSIPIGMRNSTPVVVSIYRKDYMSLTCEGIVLVDTEDGSTHNDASVFANSNKQSVNIQTTANASPVSDKLNIKLYKGHLVLTNLASGSFTCFVTARNLI